MLGPPVERIFYLGYNGHIIYDFIIGGTMSNEVFDSRLIFTEDDIRKKAEELLKMDPDPIPRFILLKEFLKADPADSEYKKAYKAVLDHGYVKKLESEQTEYGYWGNFHMDSEAVLRRGLLLGLELTHPCFQKIGAFMETVLRGEDIWHQRCEKQDHPGWWLEMFMPLVTASNLSLIDPQNVLLERQITIWRSFAQAAFAGGCYDPAAEAAAQYEHFRIKTKRPIPFYSYYCVILLTARNGILSDKLDDMILDYCLDRDEGMYYIYDRKPSECIPICETKHFFWWMRCISILSRLKGWEHYKIKFCNWVWDQMNADGFWDLINKPGYSQYVLSDSWRKSKNRIIDSSIYVMRFVTGYRGH
jgi:hypothetical protein